MSFAAVLTAQNATIGPKLGVNLAFPQLSNELKFKQSAGFIQQNATTLYKYKENINYKTESSVGFALFVQSDIKLSENFGIVGGLGVFDYQSFKINHEISRLTEYFKASDSTKINEVTTNQKVDATYKYTFITLEALLKYSIDKLNIMVGPSFAFNVNAKVKTTSEYEDANYLSPVVNIKLAVNYDIDIDDNMMIAPEINFAYPLTNAREDDNFKAKYMNLGFNVVLKYVL